MQLATQEEAEGWRHILRHRYWTERAHSMAAHNYMADKIIGYQATDVATAETGQIICPLIALQTEEIQKPGSAEEKQAHERMEREALARLGFKEVGLRKRERSPCHRAQG